MDRKCFWDCIDCYFFFKQKTAYDMRISDCSSDVCSSDLLTILLAKHRGVKAAYLCLMHDASTQEKPSLVVGFEGEGLERAMQEAGSVTADRKSTRLNSSH